MDGMDKETGLGLDKYGQVKVQRNPGNENVVQSAQDIIMDQRLTFQQDNNPKHTA